MSSLQPVQGFSPLLSAEQKREEKIAPVLIQFRLPRVLLALCFSFLHGGSRQSLSLVCKYWCAVEKDPAAWPNTLILDYLSRTLVKLLSPRLQNKRFDQLIVGPLTSDISVRPLLHTVKVTDLQFAGCFDVLDTLHEMKFANTIESLSFESNVALSCPWHNPCRQLHKLSSLTSLTLGFLHDGDYGPLLKCCPLLRSLSLDADTAMYCLSIFSTLTRLETLTISPTTLDYSHFSRLCAEIKSLPQLSSLSVTLKDSSSAHLDLTTAFQALALSSLREFHCTVSLFDMPEDVWRPLGESKTLTTLCLNEEGVGDEGLLLERNQPVTGKFLQSFARNNLLTSLEIRLVGTYRMATSDSMKTLAPSWTAEGLGLLCSLTHLVNLTFDIVLTSSLDLRMLGKLTSLESLNMTVFEDLDIVASESVWLSTLPTSLRKLKFVWEPNLIVTWGVSLSTYRTYSLCLPQLNHLVRLNDLELQLGGLVTETEIRHISHLPLQNLCFDFPSCTILEENVGAIACEATVKALSTIKTLNSVGLSRKKTEDVDFWNSVKAPFCFTTF